jgi:hypothetical protein
MIKYLKKAVLIIGSLAAAFFLCRRTENIRCAFLGFYERFLYSLGELVEDINKRAD